jgi:hypothetical protein
MTSLRRESTTWFGLNPRAAIQTRISTFKDLLVEFARPMNHADSKVLMNSRAIVDACRPYEWMSKFPEVAETSPELRRKVLVKYGRTFFGLR